MNTDNNISELEILLKHIGFQGKTDDKWWLQESVRHYLETGKPNGSFLLALIEAMEEYAFIEKHLFQIKRAQQALRQQSEQIANKPSSPVSDEQIEAMAESVCDEIFVATGNNVWHSHTARTILTNHYKAALKMGEKHCEQKDH